MRVLRHLQVGSFGLPPFALTMMLVAAGCVPSKPGMRNPNPPLRVTSAGQPFQMWDGALARKVADAQCGPQGVKVSIYDRFDPATGAWVYPGGCA